MCDSDDPGEGRSGMDLTGFLFGNIDERGQLEDDGLLDGDSKKMLSSLTRFGFGSMLSEVLDQEEVSKEDQEKGKILFTNLRSLFFPSFLRDIYTFLNYLYTTAIQCKKML